MRIGLDLRLYPRCMCRTCPKKPQARCVFGHDLDDSGRERRERAWAEWATRRRADHLVDLGETTYYGEMHMAEVVPRAYEDGIKSFA